MTELRPAAVGAPKSVWRIGRSPDPLLVRQINHAPLRDVRSGNRFDSWSGVFDMLYFATDLEGCFAETLRRFRPKMKLADDVKAEWEQLGYMPPGNLPAEWRLARSAVEVSFTDPDALFLDLETPETMEYLWDQLMPALVAWSYQELDVPVVRGGDRRVTRLIAEWTAAQVSDDDTFIYAGIRYISRLGDWECWAVFGDVGLAVEDYVTITKDMPEFQTIADLYGITIH